MPNEAYINLAIRRQAILERLKSGEVANFAKEIQKIEKLIRLAVLGLGEELGELSRTKLNNLLRLLQADQGVAFKAATQSFLKRSADIAAVYMSQELLDLNNTVDVRGTRLNDFTKKGIFKRVVQRPLSTDGELLEPWIKNFTDKETRRVSGAIRAGHAQGLTNQEMVQRLIGTKDKNFKNGILQTTRRNASTVVRTSVQHVASAARQEVWEANRDIVSRYQFLATLDRVTSRICRTLDGQEYEFGKGPIPPVHPNCLLPGTLVTASCGISRVFKRAYKGKVFFIQTRSGNQLTVTPNHPILTDTGWGAAQLLNVGDKCFVNSCRKGVVSAKGENDTVFATVEQITESLGGPLQVPSAEVPTTTPNFHNDAIDGEVASVWSNHDLGFVDYAVEIEHGGKSGFVMANGNRAVFGTGLHPLVEFGPAGLPPSDFGVCGLGEFQSLFRCGTVHSGLLLGRTITQRDSVFTENSFNRSWADAEGIRNSPDSYPGSVFLDNIVNIEIRDFCGHVYNLETDNHLIESNGIVTHNCRSTTIPILNEKFSFLSKGRTRSGEQGPVSAKTDYYDWLKRQNKQAQLDVLGPARTKLFRDGGMTADRFRELQFDKNFAPLSLKGMRKLEPKAFEKAGL